MSAAPAPIDYIWWLVSRASGIVALLLITLSVLIGLAMAAKILRRPGIKRILVKLHEHVALTALLAIGVHGMALLGDHWLKPGWRGITIPFALSYRPQFTGLGIIGGYLALLLGPSFYLRRRIGTRRWRRLHTLVLAAWVLSAVHTLGSGSDAQRTWLQLLVLAPAVAVVYLLVLRVLKPAPSSGREKPRRRLSRGAVLTTGTMAILLVAPAPAPGAVGCHSAGPGLGLPDGERGGSPSGARTGAGCGLLDHGLGHQPGRGTRGREPAPRLPGLGLPIRI